MSCIHHNYNGILSSSTCWLLVKWKLFSGTHSLLIKIQNRLTTHLLYKIVMDCYVLFTSVIYIIAICYILLLYAIQKCNSYVDLLALCSLLLDMNWSKLCKMQNSINPIYRPQNYGKWLAKLFYLVSMARYTE